MTTRSPELQPEASGHDVFDLPNSASANVTATSMMTDNGNCPPCGSLREQLEDARAHNNISVLQTTPALTVAPILCKYTATAGYTPRPLSPIPGTILTSFCMLTASQMFWCQLHML